MTGVCQATLPLLSSMWTWLGIAGLGILGKLAYSYSSLTFWPSFLTLTSIWRTIMVTFNALTSLRRYYVFVALAFVTTFLPTITAMQTGELTGTLNIGWSILTDFWDNIVLVVKNFSDGMGLMLSWIQTSENICGLYGNKGILLDASFKFWSVISAYILVLRIDDMMFGHGMTREIEWPEKYKTIAVVTLLSTTVYSGSLLVESIQTGQQFVQVFMDNWMNVSGGNTTAQMGSN